MKGPESFHERAGSVEKALSSSPIIRAVNFHNTSKAHEEQIDRQLAGYNANFAPVNERELDEYLLTGRWRKNKPGLIVAVYEGYRSGYDVMAPLLEKHGFTGWFFLITSFLNAPVNEQLSFARSHSIGMRTHEYSDGRYALTWDQVRQLSNKHVIASHARSHRQLSRLDPATAEREIVGSQEDFVKNLGRKVRAFVSLTGPAYGENPATDRVIESAGYDFVVSNFKIQRIRPQTNHG